ncbi:MAG: MFS transporter, partial [Shewanella sp.]
MFASGFIQRTLDALSVYYHRRVLILLLLGFSAGLPLMLVFSTLSFWLREAGVDRTAIGYFSWIALAYAFKWAWSPLVDRLSLPFLTRVLGRRRSWMLFAQLLLVAAILGMSFSDPVKDLERLAICALMVAFASATQDIVIDAFRIESAPEKMQAALAAAYQVGYRSAMIVATAGALTIAAWVEPSHNEYHLIA